MSELGLLTNSLTHFAEPATPKLQFGSYGKKPRMRDGQVTARAALAAVGATALHETCGALTLGQALQPVEPCLLQHVAAAPPPASHEIVAVMAGMVGVPVFADAKHLYASPQPAPAFAVFRDISCSVVSRRFVASELPDEPVGRPSKSVARAFWTAFADAFRWSHPDPAEHPTAWGVAVADRDVAHDLVTNLLVEEVAGSQSAAIDLVFATLDGWMERGRTDRVNEFLRLARPDRFAIPTALSVLSVTLPHRRRLAGRTVFLHAFRAHLEATESPARAAALLRGLV